MNVNVPSRVLEYEVGIIAFEDSIKVKLNPGCMPLPMQAAQSYLGNSDGSTLWDDVVWHGEKKIDIFQFIDIL